MAQQNYIFGCRENEFSQKRTIALHKWPSGELIKQYFPCIQYFCSSDKHRARELRNLTPQVGPRVCPWVPRKRPRERPRGCPGECPQTFASLFQPVEDSPWKAPRGCPRKYPRKCPRKRSVFTCLFSHVLFVAQLYPKLVLRKRFSKIATLRIFSG